MQTVKCSVKRQWTETWLLRQRRRWMMMMVVGLKCNWMFSTERAFFLSIYFALMSSGVLSSIACSPNCSLSEIGGTFLTSSADGHVWIQSRKRAQIWQLMNDMSCCMTPLCATVRLFVSGMCQLSLPVAFWPLHSLMFTQRGVDTTRRTISSCQFWRC